MLVAAAGCEVQRYFGNVAFIVAFVQLLLNGISHHEADHCQLYIQTHNRQTYDRQQTYTKTVTDTHRQTDIVTLIDQGSHSLSYKKCQVFRRTPEAFFQDTVTCQKWLNIETNSSY